MIVTWNQPIASDNSGQTPNVQTTHQSGSSFPVGTSTVIYTFTDAAGNEATCSFNVNIVSGKKTYTVDFTICLYVRETAKVTRPLLFYRHWTLLVIVKDQSFHLVYLTIYDMQKIPNL